MTPPRVKVLYQGPGAKEGIAVAAFATDSEHIAAQVARTEHLRFGPWQLKTWAFTDYNMCHQCHVPFHHTNQCRRTPACSICGDTTHPAQSCPDTNDKTVHFCMSCKLNGHTRKVTVIPVVIIWKGLVTKHSKFLKTNRGIRQLYANRLEMKHFH